MTKNRFRFRAWDKKNKRMLYNIQEAYDGYCVEDEKGNEVENCCVDCFSSFFPYDDNDKNEDFIVEQCTGLKDKNGRLIYEGDIIRLPWQAGWPDLIGVVKFNELYACFLLSKTITDKAEQSFWWNAGKEVIGNIHENPELLEDK